MLSINDIVVARDFSSVSDRALRHGLSLAARTGARLHVLHAEVLHDHSASEDERPSPSEGVDELRAELKERGVFSAASIDEVTVLEAVRRDVAPAPAILRYAADEEVDLLMLGTHGRRGPSRILLGSVAEEVVRRARQPVLTVRGEEDGPSSSAESIEQILVPVDFSDFSREALRHAREWAALYGAEIDVLHVIEETLHPAFYVGGVRSIYDAEPNIEQKVRQRLEAFVEATEGPDVNVRLHVGPGSAASAIAEFVEEQGIDLVCMSTHGRTGMERFFLGSVAEKVVRHVHCPVLTVKAFGTSLVSKDAEERAATDM